MANTRRLLKPYKGYTIVVQNGYRYFGHKNHDTIVAYSLNELKQKISEKGDNKWK